LVVVFPIPGNTSKDGISHVIIWYWYFRFLVIPVKTVFPVLLFGPGITRNRLSWLRWLASWLVGWLAG
jgi:hypothetical protein